MPQSLPQLIPPLTPSADSSGDSSGHSSGDLSGHSSGDSLGHIAAAPKALPPPVVKALPPPESEAESKPAAKAKSKAAAKARPKPPPATNLQASKARLTDAVDVPLLMLVLWLLMLGTVMVFSTTIAADSETLQINYVHLFKHLLFIGLGAGLLLSVSRLKLVWLQASSKVLLLCGFVLLGAIFVPGLGVEANGSLRWLALGSLQLQPSELSKIATVVYFADYLARKRDNLHLFKVSIINVGLVLGFLGLLLLLEPDFGSVVVITATVVGMMFLAGVRFWHFCISMCVAGAFMTLLIWMEPYRLARLISYRDPWADPFNSGFQLVQALIAIGRGEWFGSGLGNSIQKLSYLPHVSNDFLISVVGEELGAVGIFVVVGLFIGVLLRAFHIAAYALRRGDLFAGFLAQGVGLLITIQAIVHLGVNTGLLPTKGLNLPLMSYGGSSMLSCMLGIGLLLAVYRQASLNPRPRS